MASRKFKFVSPGIFTNEVDESILPPVREADGPVIIGRFRKGPAMRPVKVSTYQDFLDTFGEPVPGVEAGDVWRSDTPVGPTYAAYAAKAWLRSEEAPATIVRLLGEKNGSYTSDGTLAGYKMDTDPGGKIGDTGILTIQDSTNTQYLQNGGAFGMWVVESGTMAQSNNTGTLAAIWYLPSGSMMEMSGNRRSAVATGENEVTGASVIVKSVDTGNTYRTILKNSSAQTVKEFVFNFDVTSPLYARDVFNTNPTLTNSDVNDTSSMTSGENLYWLGETFDRAVKEHTVGTQSPSSTSQFAFIAPLMSGSAVWSDRQTDFVNAKTGWFFSQDLGVKENFSAPDSGPQRLFRFEALDHGSWAHNLKIAIEDIKPSLQKSRPYGSFTVAVYHASTKDTDAKSAALERYTNCDLNPSSPNYIAKRIGDRSVSWSYTLDKQLNLGQYANMSRYIRVEMNASLETTSNKGLIPFGFTGPVVPVSFLFVSGTGPSALAGAAIGPVGKTWLSMSTNPENPIPKATDGEVNFKSYATASSAGAHDSGSEGLHPVLMVHHHAGGVSVAGHVNEFTSSWQWPRVGIRSASTDGAGSGPGNEMAYWGVNTTETSQSDVFDPGYTDYLRGLPFDSTVVGRFDELTNPNSGLPRGSQYSWVFSLDDIKLDGSGVAFHRSGSRKDGTSISAISSSWKKVVDTHKINRFWAPMYGGSDGLDVTEAEPFANKRWTVGTTNQRTNYAWNSVWRAIRTVADPDVVECNLMAMPGIVNDDLTDELMTTARTRADALAIVDLADVFIPHTENTNSYSSNLGTLDTIVTNTQNRDVNNSYACTYYPWIQILDTATDRLLWAPPSVVALGTYGSSQAKSELWFAPAGFTRGGLTEGSAGVPVISVSERLSKANRDKLYESNINPIARFPSEGIVIFGQKTLQSTPSALDRINVRRLMIHVKKEISRIAATVLFDQNVPVTWSRFTSKADNFLKSVKSRFGVVEYKIVLDETTTTADLIDRNILYAKIFIKPARAIEFIAIDFIISRHGASFDD